MRSTRTKTMTKARQGSRITAQTGSRKPAIQAALWMTPDSTSPGLLLRDGERVTDLEPPTVVGCDQRLCPCGGRSWVTARCGVASWPPALRVKRGSCNGLLTRL